MPPEADATSGSQAALDTSAASSGTLEGSASSASASPSDPQARINALMSSWQKEQSENARLRDQLTAAITERASLQERLSEFENGSREKETAASEELTSLRTKVSQLEASVATLTADNDRLQLIVERPELAAYRDVLPRGANKEELTKTAEAILAARTAEQSRLRDALTGTQRTSGGQTPRGAAPRKRSASEINEYLKAATSSQDFEQRLAEVNAGL